jgi:hypothetical protein
MADDLRPEQVAKITATPPLPAELTDAILDSSPEELAAAIDQKADDTREWLEQLGKLPPSRSVLDFPFGQRQYLVAAWGLLAPWGLQPGWDAHSFRNLQKVVPSDIAEAVDRLLRWGGFLPPEPQE